MKIKQYLAVAMCAFALSACSSLPEKIVDFVEDTESKCDSFDEKDWETNQKEYEALINDLQENYDSYTDEEKKEVGRSIGRYTKLVMKKGMKQLEDLGKNFAPAIDGFFESLTEDED